MSDGKQKTAASSPDGGTLTLQCLGDLSLNGSYCDPQHHALLAASLAEVAGLLGPCDLRVANWESPLWGDGGVNELKRPRLATTPQAARCALPLKLDVAILANNHVYDCLEKGFENTVRFLEDSGIAHLGAGASEAEAARPLLLDRRGLKLGLLAYVGAETNPSLPEGAGVHLNLLEEDRALREVASLAGRVDVVGVHLHWGAVELIGTPTVEQRRLARRIVDAGAAVVVAGHAHCLHGQERWKQGQIFYGMGNFLFGPFAAVPGDPGRPWPVNSRRAAAATCRVSRRGVQSASMMHLLQKGLLLEPEDTPRRRRRQARLDRRLRLSDRALARAWKRDVFFQWRILRPLRALLRLRWRHVRALLGAPGGR